MKAWILRLVAVAGLAVVTGPLAEAGDWPHWRGPEQDGISREKNLPSDWSLDGKNLVWTSEIGGRAAPIVMNGRVYLNCRTAQDEGDPVAKIDVQEQVVCWDAETGEVLWRDLFNVVQTDIPAPRVGWASMVGDKETGFVYVHSVSGIFRCYTPDGKVVWEHSLFEEYGKISGYGGRTQTPIIDEDRVVVSFLAMNWGETKSPPPKQTYYAFDKRTGELLWTSAPGGAPLDTNYSVPIVKVINGVRMMIGGNSDGSVCAFQARTGKPIWRFRMSKRGLNVSVVTDGKYVYAAHGEDNIDSVKFGRIQCIDATGQGDVTETHGLWRVEDLKVGYASLLVKDGILYAVADTGRLYAFDSKTGDQLWDYNLGTVGKGSPVWADGKLYVMEVNGNIHILKPSREGCEELSHVELKATQVEGLDEIYASPAIANGKVYFVTRDRTICIAKEGAKPESAPIPPMGKEIAPQQEITQLHLYPYETVLRPGDEVEYEIHGFDKNGQFVRTLDLDDAELTLEGINDFAKLDKLTLKLDNQVKMATGSVTATFGELSTKARFRVFPELPWKWDFSGLEGTAVPETWILAFLKLKPAVLDGEPVMRQSISRGRPSVYVWLGPPDMKDYTIQADFLMKEEKRRLPTVGVTAQRYNFVMKGNFAKLGIQTWPAHLRLNTNNRDAEQRFLSNPDVWYTLKMRVDIKDGKAHVKGKVWEREKAEPEAWTMEVVDPHPNTEGSPGLYFYSLADSYVDNVIVTPSKK